MVCFFGILDKKRSIYVNKKISIQIVIIVMTSLILSAFFGVIIMSIQRLWVFSGSEDGWLSYWGGIFGAVLGVAGTFSVMKIQINQELNDKKKEKEAKVVLSNTRIMKGAKLIESYFDKNKQEIHRGVPLINVGITPVTNVNFSFKIINFEEATSDYSAGGQETRVIDGFNENTNYAGLDGLLKVSPIHLREGPGFLISFKGDKMSGSLRYDQSKSKGNIPVIMPGQTEYLLLPNEIISLYVFHMVCFMVCPDVDYDDQDPSRGDWPILQIDINFTDYLNQIHNVSYNVTVENQNFDDYSFDLISRKK